MKLLLLVLALALPAFPQVTATVKPISISGSAAALGGGQVGFWKLDLCSRYPVPIEMARARVMQAFPLLRELPNRLAEDLATRHSSNSFWSVLARWGPPIVSGAGAAFATRGIILSNTTQIGIGQGVSLLGMLFTRAGQRAPNPGLYWSDLMPDRVSIPANDCGSGWLVASGIMKGAAPMTALIDIPGLAVPVAELVEPDLAAERLEKILRARGLDDREILAMVASR